METFEQFLYGISEIQLNADQMNRIRGGDWPTDPPDDPPGGQGGN